MAFVPCLLTAIGFGVGFLWGFEYFVPGSSPLGMTATYGILLPYYAIALAGTIWIYHDSRQIKERTRRWEPNPWTYIVGGALGLEGYFVTTALAAGPLTAELGAALVGRFIVNLTIASVVAGPVYLINRRRYMDG